MDEITTISQAVTDALKSAMLQCEDPEKAYKSIPFILTGMAGSHIGAMRSNGVLADGENDQMMDRCVAELVECAAMQQQPTSDHYRKQRTGT